MQGTIEKINNNGICIAGKWYNAIKEIEGLVKPEILGAEVELTLLDGSNKFTKITILKGKMPSPMTVTDTQLHIIRQNAMTQASAFLSLCLQHSIIENKEDIPFKDFEDMYFKFAERCENWVKRK